MILFEDFPENNIFRLIGRFSDAIIDLRIDIVFFLDFPYR